MSLLLRARRSPGLRALTAPLRAARVWLRHPGARYEQRVWERLRETLAEDPVVHVPDFEGAFQLDARSHVLRRVLLDGVYEPALAALCTRLADPSRDALDVGANAGFFSVLLARRLAPAQRVVALEPTPAMAARLCANLARNGVAGRVSVVEAAAAEHAGEAVVRAIAGKEEYATLGRALHPSLRADTPDRHAEVAEIPVRVLRLDDLVNEMGLRPGFVKIDVEGNEHRVLGGATRLLAEHRPLILLEINDELLRANGSSAREVAATLTSAGYRLHDPHRPDLPPASLDRLETPHELEEVLAIPAGTRLR